MRDADCVAFLQWALPELRMRWRGFRKVRRQVCKRIGRRLKILGLADIAAYRAFLLSHPEEWSTLDSLCRIPISRFFRDRGVFECLKSQIFPALARQARTKSRHELHVWSAGCGAGEEPYTLSILWKLAIQPHFPQMSLHILGTDSDPHQLQRARDACYAHSSLKEVPREWREAAFEQTAGRFCLRPGFRANVDFRLADVRQDLPEGPFDLILCRNLAFTYFDQALQCEIAHTLVDRLWPGGLLVLGQHESIPCAVPNLARWSSPHPLWQRASPSR